MFCQNCGAELLYPSAGVCNAHCFQRLTLAFEIRRAAVVAGILEPDEIFRFSGRFRGRKLVAPGDTFAADVEGWS